jgi:flavin reductase (DIM6/NTAB) family NADH-FMN oxidoreductase RutF
VLEGAIAMLHCDLHDVADGGDHAVVVGHVVELDHAPDDAAGPLRAVRLIYDPPTAAAQPAPGCRSASSSSPAH